ncbi:LacI family DNA-binding transcriptional regulator [Plantibacter sp. YIM 135249]|uniref:LacI family DNA-binding transcriptional regulator n=1 Tax=Plantibacter sp. YIM 135249 TaxID=3423918 RepID=UPI003D33FC0D
MAVTARDVAARANTSTAVVSYVLNNGPRPVAAATRLRVLEAVKELGYLPNGIAKALRTSRTGLVGVAFPDAMSPYFSALAKDIESELQKAGKLTLFSNSETENSREEDVIAAFRSVQVDGIISVSSEYITASDVDVVYVFNAPLGIDPTVSADDDLAVRTAYEHLVSHGHSDIGFIAGLRDTGPVGVRTAAWRALRGGDVEPFRSAYSFESAWALASELMAASSLPGAVIVATDEQAIGVLAAAHERGVRIPDDLAVISMDGSPITRFTAPALTVMEQPTRPMALAAVQSLLGDAHADVIPARLVIRRSCGCA